MYILLIISIALILVFVVGVIQFIRRRSDDDLVLVYPNKPASYGIEDDSDTMVSRLLNDSRQTICKKILTPTSHRHSDALPDFSFSNHGYGFFAQDDPKTDEKKFQGLKSRFGLIRSSWNQFARDFQSLKSSLDENSRIKVLFLARHGQGYHNLAIQIYGQKEWDRSWAKKFGDGKIVWGPDPELTDLGIQQAKDNNVAWKEQLQAGLSIPEVFYVSPFTRACDTYLYTWDGITFPHSNPSEKPTVVEDLRETIGVNTCDQRKSKTYIHNRYPDFEFEQGFTDQDVLWTTSHRETPDEQDVRATRFLRNLFVKDWNSDTPQETVSITAHSGEINSFLRVIGHRPFQLETGGMIPVIVKATL